MIRLRNSSLTVLLESSGGIFTDFTDDMWTYQRDTRDITIDTTDKFWIGFEKPITTIYPYMDTVSSVVNAMTVKYFNGTEYVDTTGLYDGTKGLTRNGFISWDVNQNSTEPNKFSGSPNQVMSTVNGLEQFWYEITMSMTTSQIVMQGLNLIFADTEDLKLEFPEIATVIDTSILKGNEIMIYESTRIDLVRTVRSRPNLKYTYDSTRDLKIEPLNQWDILNIEEMNAAARNLSISKIYRAVSNNPSDDWSQRAAYYKERSDEFLEGALLTIDFLGDGQESVGNENVEVGHPTFERD